MWYVKNKQFDRDLKDSSLDDEDMKVVLDDVFEGRAIPLGSKMYKIRGAMEGRGKSGGFRSIFFWKREEFIVFCLLFAKNEQDDLSWDERRALKVWSNEYDGLMEDELRKAVENKSFTEIKYDKA